MRHENYKTNNQYVMVYFLINRISVTLIIVIIIIIIIIWYLA